MKKSHSTKKALLASIVSLCLCIAMLAGTTFAWFTDSVSSENNIITAGNLDIELYWSRTAEDNSWQKVDGNTNIFRDDTLWEPGHTEVVYLKVVNEGSLALKYQLGVNIAEEIEGVNKAGDPFKLSDFIKFGVVETAAKNYYGTRTAALEAVKDDLKIISAGYSNSSKLYPKNNVDGYATEEYATLVVTMPEDVNNDANHNGVNVPSIKLGLNLFASQLAYESDSYGSDYDANVSISVDNWAELKQAVNDVKNGGTIYLKPGLYESKHVLVLTGKNITIHGMGGVLLKNIGGSGDHFFNVTKESNVVFRNLEFDGNKPNGKNGIFVRYNSTVTLDNCKIYNTKASSICVDQVSDKEATFEKTATVNLINSQVESVFACAFPVTGHAYENIVGNSYVHFNYDSNSTVGSFSKDSFAAAEHILINGSADGTGKMVAEGVWLTAPKTYAVTSKAGLKNLEAVLTAAKPGEGNILNANLMCDVDLSGDVWNTIDCMWIVFNGNGHTISNINCGKDAAVGRSGFWGYAGAVTINNLTLENVTSCGTQAGTFAGSADGLKLNNCFLKGTNVVTWEQNAPGAYQETASGIGAITGVTINSNLNVEIASGATVTLNLGEMTSVLNRVDNMVGREVPGYAVNSGNIVNNGKVTANVATAENLQFVVDTAVAGNNYIGLTSDVAGDVTVTQKDGVKIIFDGNGYKFQGIITVDGQSKRYETAALTIQNVKFCGVTCPDSDVYPDAYIRLSLSNDTRYTTNVTVKDCTFSGTDKNMVAVKSYTGGDWNVTLDNLTVDAGMHSLAQLANVEKGLVINDCKVYSKNGINLNQCVSAKITNCVVDVTGYAVRFGASKGTTATNAEVFEISNSTLKSACDDGDAVIMFRVTALNATLTLTNTTLEGTTTFAGNTDETTIIMDNNTFVSDGLYKDAQGNHYVYTAKGLSALNTMLATKSSGYQAVKSINLKADIDFAAYTWTTIWYHQDQGYHFTTINGNGYTLKNLKTSNGPMFSLTTMYETVVVKDLTIENAVISGDYHVGVIMGQAATNVTFDNVHIIGANVTGAFNVGGIIGSTGEFMAPVTVTFKDCSVKDSTITASGTSGDPTGASGFIGRAVTLGTTISTVVFEGDNAVENNNIDNTTGLVGGAVYGYATYNNGWTDVGSSDNFNNFN